MVFLAACVSGILAFLNVSAGGEAKKTFGTGTGLVDTLSPALLSTLMSLLGFALMTTLIASLKARRRDGPNRRMLRKIGAQTPLRVWYRAQAYGLSPIGYALANPGATFDEHTQVFRAWDSGHAKQVRRQYVARILLSVIPLGIAASVVVYASSSKIIPSTGPLTTAFNFWWFLAFAMGRLGARKQIDITRWEKILTTVFVLIAVVGLSLSASAVMPSQQTLSAVMVAVTCGMCSVAAYALGSIGAHPRGERAWFVALAVLSLAVLVCLPFASAMMGLRVWPFLVMIFAAAFYGMRQWPQRLLSYEDPIAVPPLGSALVYSWGCCIALGGALVVLHVVTMTPFHWFGHYPPLGSGSEFTLPIMLGLMGFGQHQLSQFVGNAPFNPSVPNGIAQLVGAGVLLLIDTLQGIPPRPDQLVATAFVAGAVVGLALLLYDLARRQARAGSS